MNLIYINSVDEIKLSKDEPYKRTIMPLFHGTRERMLNLSLEERNKFFEACDKVILKANEVSEKLSDEELISCKKAVKSQYFSSYSSIQYKKNGLYEYGDFYVVTSFGTAAYSYAKNGGGELGEIAYQNAIALRYLNLDLSDEMNEAIDYVIKEHEEFMNSSSIVIVAVNIDFNDLQTIGGHSFLTDDEENNKEQIDFLYEVRDEDTIHYNESFRIINLNKYVLYAVRPELFADCIKAFTDVENIDVYIGTYDRY